MQLKSNYSKSIKYIEKQWVKFILIFNQFMLNQTMLIDSSKKLFIKFGYFKSKLEHNELLFLRDTPFISGFRKK